MEWSWGTARLAVAAAVVVLTAGGATARADSDDDDLKKPVTELIVTAKRLDAARANIEADLGATSYTLTGEMVENRPGSESTSIAQVLLQAPGVMQDGSGQLRLRQSQGDLQYRINGVILPEGSADFGESLSARFAQSIKLVTGALPAQYGFQAAGVVNVTTKNGAYLDGGQVEVYGGGPGDLEPAFEYGANIGPTSVFVSGSFHTRKVGLAVPDGSARPSHDHAQDVDGIALLDHIFNDTTRAALILGLADNRLQVPNLRGLDAASLVGNQGPFRGPLNVAGVDHYPSEARDGRQREATRYAVASLMRATDSVTLQGAVFFRESRHTARANGIGDLLFTGLAYGSTELDDARGLQIEGALELAARHTLRAGVYGAWSRHKSDTQALVLPVNAMGEQLTRIPVALGGTDRGTTRKESVFVQDEWRPTDALTLNAGLRFDDVRDPAHENRFSPRANAVWTLPHDLAIHAGYARYFLPAPLQGVDLSPTLLAGTSGALPTARGNAPRSEHDDYYDVGVQWTRDSLTLGIDGYWREARDFIAEGSFGLPHLSAPFNYAEGRLRGIELTATYVEGPVTAWSNIAIAGSRGRDIVSNQFYFTAAQLAALTGKDSPLSNDQHLTASGGASYRIGAFRVIGDFLVGSGLPYTPNGAAPNGAHLPAYAQVNLAVRYTIKTWRDRPLDLRLDVANLFDARYVLRDGSGLGDGQPQWGQRRGVYVGLEQTF